MLHQKPKTLVNLIIFEFLKITKCNYFFYLWLLHYKFDPEGRFGKVNWAGIDYYNSLIDTLLSRGFIFFYIINSVVFLSLTLFLFWFWFRNRTFCHNITLWYSSRTSGKIQRLAKSWDWVSTSDINT